MTKTKNFVLLKNWPAPDAYYYKGQVAPVPEDMIAGLTRSRTIDPSREIRPEEAESMQPRINPNAEGLDGVTRARAQKTGGRPPVVNPAAVEKPNAADK